MLTAHPKLRILLLEFVDIENTLVKEHIYEKWLRMAAIINCG